MARGDVLVVGNGAREHAFVWKLKKSAFLGSIYVAPGNAGTAYIAHNISIEITDINTLFRFAREKDIELTVVGPELPLKLGIVDLFQKNGLCIFGPTASASRIETSKTFAKKLMVDHHIPTAPFRIFTSYQEANRHIHERGLPFVVKPDSLTGGKGVCVCKTIEEAEIALKTTMVDRIYGDAGDVVIVEDYLQGQERSIHALCSKNIIDTLLPVRDHKNLQNHNKGPNTGGMGTYSPIPTFGNNDTFHVEQMIVKSVLRALKRLGTPFTGCLYPGLMITADGPKVLEINARFGDPETQVLMALLANDLFLILKSYALGESEIEPIFKNNQHAVCIVLCSKEYPLYSHQSVPIYGIEEAKNLSDNIIIFYGATKLINGKLYTNGGRIVSVTAVEDSLKEAESLAYRACGYIHFEGMQYRTDIAKNVS